MFVEIAQGVARRPTFARQGHLEISTDEARVLVPPSCAVWIPTGSEHGETMWGPVTVRTLYIAPGALPDSTTTRTVAINPLLRELIVFACGQGRLDRTDERNARLVDVLLDQLADMADVSLHLPMPADACARRPAERMHADPSDRTALGQLARQAGGNLRTVERVFVAETEIGVGQWRRRLRLFHALRLLEAGASVGEVGTAVGCASPSAFTVAFTRTFGMPSTRRDQVRVPLV